ALDPSTLVRIHIPAPDLGRSRVSATVVAVDRFGNVATNVSPVHLEALGISTGDRVELRLTFDRYYALVAETFADAPPGELIVYEDSYGLVTVAISRGNAARLLRRGSGGRWRGVGAAAGLRVVSRCPWAGASPASSPAPSSARRFWGGSSAGR